MKHFVLAFLLFMAIDLSAADGQQQGGRVGAGTVRPILSTPSEFLLSPPVGNGPTVVDVQFHLRDINAIRDETETFAFEGVLTLNWRDKRQAFDPAAVGADEKVFQGAYQFDEVFTGWYPQVVLANAGDSFDVRGVTLRVLSDGTLTLISAIFATAKVNLNLRRYPFDRQRLEAVFEVLGFGADEVILQPRAQEATSIDPFRMSQWRLDNLELTNHERSVLYADPVGRSNNLILGIDVRRKPAFMLRLVALPLVIVVMLSWSVFWMDKSSVGDRVAVSFVGLLTAMTFQILIGDTLPRISYITWLHALINVSFMIMAVTVVINLVVSAADMAGDVTRGDRIDRRCRWMFPVGYLLAIASLSLLTFVIL